VEEGVKSLAVQIHAMRKRWPGFDLVHGFESDSVIWFGNLVGLERPFRVSVEYGLPTGPESPMFRLMPVVRVISPKLVLNFDAEDTLEQAAKGAADKLKSSLESTLGKLSDGR